MGEYTEKFFPENNIRYVSILDNMDTYSNENMDFMPFKSVFNEMYSKDISRKINSVFRSKMKNGEYLGSRAPYGYFRSSKEKNKLIIDKDTAPFVVEMFNRYLNGECLQEIANDLSKRKVITPSKRLEINLKETKTSDFWKESVIRRMLTNEVYIGNVVSHKTKKASIKSKLVIHLPKEEWIIKENMHEPLIDKEIFYKVQKMLVKNDYKKRKSIDSPIKHLLYCFNCKSKMQISYAVSKKDNTKITRKYFRCSNGNRYKELMKCKSHYIREDYLISSVEDLLKNILHRYKDKENLKHIAKKIETRKIEEQENLSLYNRKITEIEAIQKNMDMLYIDKLNNKIKEADFNRLYESLSSQRDILEIGIKSLDRKKTAFSDETDNKKLDNLIDNYLDFGKLNIKLINELINRIEVRSKNEIDIIFNFRSLECLK